MHLFIMGDLYKGIPFILLEIYYFNFFLSTIVLLFIFRTSHTQNENSDPGKHVSKNAVVS